MKNNLDRYPHFVASHNHWKFKTLRRAYGWSGEGKFWALNNMIADSEGCIINLNDPVRKAAVAAEIDFDIPELDQYIEFLVNKCQLLVLSDSMVTTEKVQETFSFVDEKRKRDRDRKLENSTRKTNNSDRKIENSTRKINASSKVAVENEQSKVKERKEKKSKVKQNTGAPAVPSVEGKKKFLPPSLDEVVGYMMTTIGNPKNEQHWPADKVRNQAGAYFDFYTANGWVQGKGKPIKDWKAAVRTCIRRELDDIRKNSARKNYPRQDPPVETSPPPPATAPEKSTIETEIDYLYSRFQEGGVTIISLHTQHYNYLKSAGRINFSDQQTQQIRTMAEDHFREKNITPTDAQLVMTMKKFGVLEYFKQLQQQEVSA